LLNEYAAEGEKLFLPDRFAQTSYYQNAAECIELTGSYFPYVNDNSQIISVAQSFIKRFVKNEQLELASDSGHSAAEQPIRVRPIQYSDCYEVIDGNHRIAAAFVRGMRDIEVLPEGDPVLTPAQEQILSVMWQDGRVELYQPVSLPETKNWRLVRKCTDRMVMMQKFLSCFAFKTESYLDIGASYGWFIREMRRSGISAFGVERDPMAIAVGEMVYGNLPSSVTRSDIVRFLRYETRSFDVTSCFSVLHHFALGRASIGPEDLISLIDRVTRRVLFFDTGQAHEEWFCQSLAKWDTSYVQDWLQRNTSFSKVIPLGTDNDAVPPYEKNYRRTMFACYRE
jgi:2-polyprenyl-3-methyl-5-hydroxy-6-metoxy-1,4-benzoquinol methylase